MKQPKTIDSGLAQVRFDDGRKVYGYISGIGWYLIVTEEGLEAAELYAISI